ncbi:MAG: hypothetical protein JNL30_03045 [Rubrivivax sp.]|nr:hypothetical protein [Rubrivivax sp.]
MGPPGAAAAQRRMCTESLRHDARNEGVDLVAAFRRGRWRSRSVLGHRACCSTLPSARRALAEGELIAVRAGEVAAPAAARIRANARRTAVTGKPLT